MSEKSRSMVSGRVPIQNVNHPGSTTKVAGAPYYAMRDTMLKVLPFTAPGLTEAEMREAMLPLLPEALFPGGAKVGWWSKTVQLDLEAKSIISRERSRPMRFHRNLKLG